MANQIHRRRVDCARAGLNRKGNIMSERAKLPADPTVAEQPDTDIELRLDGRDPGLHVNGDPVDTAGRPGTAVALRFDEEIERILTPYTITAIEWARLLFKVTEFPEQDPDDITNSMLASILMADSSEEVLSALSLDRAKELAGDEPGGHSPLLVIHGARPMKSDYDEGPPCYCIVDATVKATGKRIRFTTGAKAVQAAILAHVGHGWMPFEAILEIRRERTRRGYYPLNLVAGG